MVALNSCKNWLKQVPWLRKTPISLLKPIGGEHLFYLFLPVFMSSILVFRLKPEATVPLEDGQGIVCTVKTFMGWSTLRYWFIVRLTMAIFRSFKVVLDVDHITERSVVVQQVCKNLKYWSFADSNTLSLVVFQLRWCETIPPFSIHHWEITKGQTIFSLSYHSENGRTRANWSMVV